jgi:tartrate-resistant acid phosphatase type 5
LKNHPTSLYLAGHDHNLQHLQVEGYDTSFVVCGAGGASLYEITPSGRGFSNKILGFTHLHVTPEKITVQFIDTEGRRLHAFQRTPAGNVKITT